jgi:hypothetical protein
VLPRFWRLGGAHRQPFLGQCYALHRSRRCAGAFFCCTFAAAQHALGQSLWVNPGISNWFVPANWSAGVPILSTNVQANNGGTARLFDPLSREEIMAWTDGPKRVGRILLSSHPSVAHIK